MPDMDYEQYPQHEIKVLKGLDAVKMRPEMYLPNYKRDGVRQMIMISIDNFLSINRGHFNTDIHIDKEHRSIYMNFYDIPDYSMMHPDAGKRVIRLLLEELHACQCESKLFHAYQSFGVGISVANAFCKRLEWATERHLLIYENAELIEEVFLDPSSEGTYNSKKNSTLVLYPIDDISFDAV